MAIDLIIRNAHILDGTGAPAFEGDVEVEEGRIRAVGSATGGAKTEIDAARRETYFQTLETEKASADSPEAAYINGDTPLFEQTASVDGVFNRLVLYRRNLLHSGSIPEDFTPDPDPRTGRLSINTFIDVVP